jgi:hypothetical protein
LASFTQHTIDSAEIVFHLEKFRTNHPNKTYIVSLNKYGPENAVDEHFSKVPFD